MTDPAVITAIAEQLPAAALIGIMFIFVLRWIEKRDADRDERNNKHDFEIQSAMDKRDDLMRDFWRGQQESNREVLGRLAHSVEKVIVTLEAHDQRAQVGMAGAIEMMQDIREKVTAVATPPPPARRSRGTKDAL